MRSAWAGFLSACRRSFAAALRVALSTNGPLPLVALDSGVSTRMVTRPVLALVDSRIVNPRDSAMLLATERGSKRASTELCQSTVIRRYDSVPRVPAILILAFVPDKGNGPS